MRTVAAGFLLLAASAAATAQPDGAGPTAGRQLLEEFLALVQRKDWKYEPATWPKIEADARKRAEKATDAMSVYPILADVLWEMGDVHGALDVDAARTEQYKKRYGKLWSEPRAHAPDSEFTERTTV